MVTCNRCQTHNDDDASYCIHCGAVLRTDDIGTRIEQHAKQFAKEMEQLGKTLTKQTKATTQRMEKRMDDVSTHIDTWYDRTFHVFGPLVASFFFLVIFRLAIAVLEIPAVETPETAVVAAVLLRYLLPLFLVTLVSNYTTYAAKKSTQFKIFSPLLHTTAFVLILWIVGHILFDIGTGLVLPGLQTAAATLEASLPTLFVFVLLISYVVLILQSPRHPEKHP
ncbi:MAG: zinc ribbon domain-containing protein [Candidatus Thermoplasmatota archaeon]|nr:zinc ribbon domain-containing protein [Candidatus Thermoplasmatota archaeon]